MTQSRRVWPTISMIVCTPRPGSPTIRASAPCSSISLDAFERLPSLSFNRCRCMALRVPSGRIRGSAKHDRPSGACASTRKRSHIGAEQNHLWPVSAYAAGPRVAVRRHRDRRVRAHVRAALLLRHRHPAERAALAGRRQRRLVGRRGQPRLPLGGELGLRAQRRHGGERHRDRAGEAALGLRGGEVHRRAGDVRPGRVDDVQGRLCSSWRTASSMRSCHAR